MGPVTRWDLLLDGTCYQMGPVTRWDLLPDGTCYQMGPVTRWNLLPDCTCYQMGPVTMNSCSMFMLPVLPFLLPALSVTTTSNYQCHMLHGPFTPCTFTDYSMYHLLLLPPLFYVQYRTSYLRCLLHLILPVPRVTPVFCSLCYPCHFICFMH